MHMRTKAQISKYNYVSHGNGSFKLIRRNWLICLHGKNKLLSICFQGSLLKFI